MNSLQSLQDKKIVVIKGYYQEEYLKLYYPKITLVYAKDNIEAMGKVLNQEADAMIDYHAVHQYNITRHLFSDLHSIPIESSEHFGPSHQYIAMRNDWPLLKSIMDKTIQSLSAKEVHQIQKKWLNRSINRALNLSEQEQAYLKKNPVIRFCADPNWLPIEKVEGKKHLGMSADYLRAIEHNLPLSFRLVPTQSWKESLELIQAKKCDFLSSVVQTKEREQFLNFSSAYLEMPIVITTRSDTFFVHSLKNLKGKKIAIVENYAFEAILKRDYPQVDLSYVSSPYEGLRAVESGDVYAYVDTLETTSEQLRTHSFADLKISGKLEEKAVLSFGVAKNDDLLFDILEKGLQTLSDDQQKEIYDKWVYVAIEEGIDYSLLWKSLAVMGVIILFFFYRYRVTLKYNGQLLQINQELEKLNFQLEELSQTDQLTGLANRRHLDTSLNMEVSRALRYELSFCLILLDVDHFKRVNDSYGHPEGDRVLKEMADILLMNSRKNDTVGRWGGEEFLIILPETDLDHALQVAHKMQEKIRRHDFALAHSVTASFGVSAFDKENDDLAKFLSRVDGFLYEAKEAGRDCIISR